MPYCAMPIKFLNMKIVKLITALALLLTGSIVASAQLTVVGNSGEATPAPPAPVKVSCAAEAARKAITKLAADDYIFKNTGGITADMNVSKNSNNSFGDGYLQKAQKNGGVFYFNCSQQKAFAVWGNIMSKWGSKQWETGELGWPTSNHSATPGKPGAFTHFQGGSIYWSNATGSHIVKGAIKTKWSALGWENSELGFPKTDEIEIFNKTFMANDRKSLGVYQEYEGGRMYYQWGAPAAYEVRGLILGKYLEMKAQKSFLGFATSDETAVANTNGRQNTFERGIIIWSPATEAHAIPTAVLKVYNTNGGAAGKLGFATGEAGIVNGKFLQEFQGGIILGTEAILKDNKNPNYIKMIEQIKLMKPVKIDDN